MHSIVFHDIGKCLVGGKGWNGPIYSKIIERNFFKDETKKNAFVRPENLDIILCWDKPNKPYTAKSLDYLGITDYVILGQGTENWQNVFKIDLVLEYLTKECKTEYILHLDAADVLICDDPQILLNRFLEEFNCGVLFNAETESHWPNEVQSEEVEFEKNTYSGKYCHLNSGCFIGRRDATIKMMQEASRLLKNGHSVLSYDDQNIVRKAHMNLYPLAKIDNNRLLFQVMGYSKMNDIVSPYFQKPS